MFHGAGRRQRRFDPLCGGAGEEFFLIREIRVDSWVSFFSGSANLQFKRRGRIFPTNLHPSEIAPAKQKKV